MKQVQKTSQISSATIDLITDELLNLLKDRPREISTMRFGLDGKKPRVLGKIGEEFSITRERVRQIESDSFKKLQVADKSKEFDWIIDRAVEIIEYLGGFCEKRTLKKKLKSDVTGKERNKLMLILNSSERLQFKKGKLSLKGFWFMKKEKVDSDVVKIHNFIVKYIKERKEPLSFEEIFEYINESQWKEFFEGEKGTKRLLMILSMSCVAGQNILGEWGLRNWKIISQRGAREKAYLVLRKYEKPLHFREITQLINKHWIEKKALPQTVHNELIKDGRFVLIGRGIYGLNVWGYPEGTVKDIIIAYLQEQDGPIKKETIIEYVLSKKQVKKTTVVVTLADKVAFDKDQSGMFTVRK
ncbi:MAG: sigma factor-like helix-turn-helix DNA-binding protein [Patescibacteria group bacterium]|nr:sigma factor-like helix-turn-helix DNA-binding protein [Patescibacteria group bacterium]